MFASFGIEGVVDPWIISLKSKPVLLSIFGISNTYRSNYTKGKKIFNKMLIVSVICQKFNRNVDEGLTLGAKLINFNDKTKWREFIS